jgi:hypothetical protein
MDRAVTMKVLLLSLLVTAVVAAVGGAGLARLISPPKQGLAGSRGPSGRSPLAAAMDGQGYLD